MCKRNLLKTDFSTYTESKSGTKKYQSFCIDCEKKYRKIHYAKNKDKYNQSRIKNQKDWTTNIRVEVLTHYGNCQ